MSVWNQLRQQSQFPRQQGAQQLGMINRPRQYIAV